jgi:hypothetical protein
VTCSGANAPLVGLFFYLGCVSAAISTFTLSKERWAWWAGMTVLWAAFWLNLVAVL